MTASAKFLSAVAIAFVAGVASTSAYMSRGDVRTDAPDLSHGSAPSLTERLQAEAQGRSLPWSDPTKAPISKPASPKLRFTPGPTDASAEGSTSDAGGKRGPIPQAMPVPTPVQPLDDGGRRREVRLAERARQALPALAVERVRPAPQEPSQHALNEESGSSRPQVANIARPTSKPHSAPSRNLPSLDAVGEARLTARRPEPSQARPASPYRTVRLSGRDGFGVDAPLLGRSREFHVEASDWSSEGQRRAGPRRNVAASDGLMRWLSGPGGRF